MHENRRGDIDLVQNHGLTRREKSSVVFVEILRQINMANMVE